MDRKNILWLSLALAICFGGAPGIAQAAQNNNIPPPAKDAQPSSSHLDLDQRDVQRTVPGPYRLTYTLTEMDGSKRIGSQRYAIVLDSGPGVPPAQLRLGTKVPLETGEFQAGSSSTQTQISYIDVGLNIQASLRSFANGLELRSHVIQSGVDAQQSLTKDPMIRQTDFQSTVLLNENKPLTIGNVDMPGTTHVLQIQVEINKIP